MKVFSTKYALTDGIQELEVETSTTSESMVHLPGSYPNFLHGEGNEWHRTREQAVARAEEMRRRKIDSLKRQIEKLNKMQF